MIKRYMVLTILVLFIEIPAFSQVESDKDKEKKKQEKEEQDGFKKRLFFGGYLWASFGTITQVEVAPQVGYHLTDRFDVGVGVKYMYFDSRSYFSENFSSHIFGGNVFTDFIIIKDLNKVLPFRIQGQMLGHLEYEGLNMPSRIDIFTDRNVNRFWAHSYFVGGGLRQQIGETAFINFFVLYNLNYEEYMPYDSPFVVRIGFGF